jgi:hypothetical protein
MLRDSGRARGALLPAAAVLFAALALAAPAAAQQPSAADKETARALMDTGDEKMDARDFPAALKAYQAADAMMRLPMTGIAVAKAQAAGGMLIEARETALHVSRLPAQPGETPAYARARADASALASALAGRIPSVQVVIDHPPADVVIAVDGTPLLAAAATLPRKVNPGRHVLTASAVGFDPAHAEVTVAEGAALLVPLSLSPRSGADPGPAAPPRARGEARRVSPLVYVGFSVGGAGLIVGAAAGVLSLQKTSALKAACPGGSCPAGKHADLASANALANLSNGGIVVGVAGAVLGVVGVVKSRPRDRAPEPVVSIEPVIGPGALGLRGTF